MKLTNDNFPKNSSTAEIVKPTGPSHDKVVMCPVLTKSVISEYNYPFKLENADLDLCTHLIGIDEFALKKMGMKFEI